MGLEPSAYHTTNLLLHVLDTLLVFWLILILSNEVFIALVSALFFGVHPLHVESVAWVTERKDVLSTFFLLQAMIYYLLYKKKQKGFFTPTKIFGVGGYYYLSLSAFFLALLSKPMVVSLPFILLLFDYLSYREFNKSILLEKAPYFLLSVIIGILTIYTQIVGEAVPSTDSLTFVENILTACRGVVFYLTKVILPINLSAFYPYPEIISIYKPEFFSSLFALLVLTIAVFYSRKYSRRIIFGTLFFIITILPVLKLFPAGAASAADRYMYLPSIGLFYMAGLAFYKMYRWEGVFETARKLSVVLFLGVLILTFSVLSYKRNNIWQDGETLWLNVLENYPEVSIAHNNLGHAYTAQGRSNEAIKEYKTALRLDPNYATAHNNLGSIYVDQGLLDEAIKEYKTALRLDPNYATAHNNLGSIYVDQGLLDEAVKEYKTALRIKPDYVDAHNNLGNAYAAQGSLDDAIREYQLAIELESEHVTAYFNLGLTYYNKGLSDLAISSYKEALRIDPYDTDVLNNLGNVYIRKGLLGEALNIYKEVLKIDFDSSIAHYNLGLTYKKKGLYNKAGHEFQEALRIDPDFKEAQKNLMNLIGK